MSNLETTVAVIGFLGWVTVLVLAILERSARKEARHQATLAHHYQEQADVLAEQFKQYGAQGIKWARPEKHNKADDFYWLVIIDREQYLFTEEAMNVSYDRAKSMIKRKWL
ncbi:MAG: hypothetical protein MUP44_06400 [Anaerolineales bacterium]|nr:hypothetical protein [Anaerolineales bacterium]